MNCLSDGFNKIEFHRVDRERHQSNGQSCFLFGFINMARNVAITNKRHIEAINCLIAHFHNEFPFAVRNVIRFLNTLADWFINSSLEISIKRKPYNFTANITVVIFHFFHFFFIFTSVNVLPSTANDNFPS